MSKFYIQSDKNIRANLANKSFEINNKHIKHFINTSLYEPAYTNLFQINFNNFNDEVFVLNNYVQGFNLDMNNMLVMNFSLNITSNILNTLNRFFANNISGNIQIDYITRLNDVYLRRNFNNCYISNNDFLTIFNRMDFRVSDLISAIAVDFHYDYYVDVFE